MVLNRQAFRFLALTKYLSIPQVEWSVLSILSRANGRRVTLNQSCAVALGFVRLPLA